jgi:hypothetical protein
MRHVLASTILALIIGLVACGGSEAPVPNHLFDTARSDVQKFKGEDGRDLGLVNTTHRVVWDFEHGYSRFGADRNVVWGPLASFPEGELASMEASDIPPSTGDGIGQTSSALSGGTGGGAVGGGSGTSHTVCTCCFVRSDKTCGCFECRSY